MRGTTVYVRDVASVRDGYAPQTNMVHVEGHRSVLMSILKNGNASTPRHRGAHPGHVPAVAAKLPKELKMTLLFDQSLFVRAAVEGVVKEAAIAAGLTALMILLFLGSWRATLVVVVSIPLSILVAVMVLYALGQTLNVMTLGGMSLAVGILVDDATVEIENIHRNLAQKKPILRAILDGAQEIAVPAFVSPCASASSSCRWRSSPARPLALHPPGDGRRLRHAHLVPPLAHPGADAGALPPQRRGLALRRGPARPVRQRPLRPPVPRVRHGFDRLRSAYGGPPRPWPWSAGPCSWAASWCSSPLSLSLFPMVGRDFFPSVDAGLVKLHVRGPPGTRIEETERRLAGIEATIRDVIPPSEIETMIDILGTPYSGLNLSLSEGALILAGRRAGPHRPQGAPRPDARVRAAGCARSWRSSTPTRPSSSWRRTSPPRCSTSAWPRPSTCRSWGRPATTSAPTRSPQEIAAEVRKVPGAADVHLAQVVRQPELRIDVDRTMAAGFGLRQQDVANDILVSLSSSSQVQPSLLARQ